MQKAISILTVLAKQDETMDLSFAGGYLEICEAINELKAYTKAARELHVSYAKIIEQMAIEDFNVEGNINIETERKWFDDNIKIAIEAIKNNQVNPDGTLIIK